MAELVRMDVVDIKSVKVLHCGAGNLLSEIGSVIVTPEDLIAVTPILESLDVSWWLRDKHLKALAQAYALGKQTKDTK